MRRVSPESDRARLTNDDDYSGGFDGPRSSFAGAAPCAVITALLLAFAALAMITGGVVVAAFGPSSPTPGVAPGAYRWETELTDDGRVWRARVFRTHKVGGEAAQSWADVAAGLADGSLGASLGDALRSSPHAEAFFWETVPIASPTAPSTTFEMATIAAPGLAGSRADGTPFAAHLGGEDGGRSQRTWAKSLGAKSFANLGGDAVLVAPYGGGPRTPSTYAHLGVFLREAPPQQQAELWAELGRTLQATLFARGARPTWLSTEGSGVSWLHLRLDSTPKYYHYAPWKRYEPAA